MRECLCEKQGRFPLVSHDLITSLTSAEFSQVYVGKVFHDLAHSFAVSISSGRGFRKRGWRRAVFDMARQMCVANFFRHICLVLLSIAYSPLFH